MRYTIQKGDTLSGIAKTHLGDASRWREIFVANAAIDNPDLIRPGMVIDNPGSYTGDWVRPDKRGPLRKVVDWLWGE